MLKQVLSKVNAYIPSYWPLQSFIATNPLYGLIQHPFDDCLSNLNKYIPINGTLSIDYYHRAYANGEIGLNSLKKSVKEFLLDKNIFNESNHIILLELLINSENQIQLEQLCMNNFKDKSILISSFIEGNNNYLDNKKVQVKISKFLADFFDLGQSKWKMPTKSNNLYQAWLEYNVIENSYIKDAIEELNCENSSNAIIYLVEKLGINDEFLEQYFIEIIFKILGWCSLIKWLEERPDNPYISKSAQINDILAMWLSLEYALSLEFGCKFNSNLRKLNFNLPIETFKEKIAKHSDVHNALNNFTLKLIWQRSLEIEYQSEILNKIKLASLTSKTTSNEGSICKSQLVFCIDTRSEGIRRKLEFIGNHETFGFAGFFGIGFRLHDEKSNSCSLQCPAIVIPDVTLINKSDPQNDSALNKIKTNLSQLLNRIKSTFFSPLVLFDMVGMYFSLSLIFKTLIPNKTRELFDDNRNIKYSEKSIDVFDKQHGFTKPAIAEKVNFVLKAIGLINNFAPFVIMAGHIAESANNPFQSSLDCGACGGNGGIPNSIAFCQALNDHEVRTILKEKYAICIPDNTFFVSACHNTTTDKFDYYNLNLMSEEKKEAFIPVDKDINSACDLLRSERLSLLDGNNNVNNRKSNWAELVPEMALANNAAFIIAPRKITKDINLNRRTFLHSYDPDLDPDGEILSFIFNAPVIVGHWINSQYYFSTTDHHIYGAGNKAIHNVLGGFGVMEGNFSDLKIGLPLQSIFYQDKLMHQPLRLTVFVYANKELVEKIISESPNLKNLFNGRWIHLEILEPSDFNQASQTC